MKRKRKRHHAYKGIFILDLLYKLFVKGKLFYYRRTLEDRQYRHFCFTHNGRMESLDNGILYIWTVQVVLFFLMTLPADIDWYLRKHEFLFVIVFMAPLITVMVLLKDGPWYYTKGRLCEIDLDMEYKEQPLAIRILYQLAYILLALAVMAAPFLVGYGVFEILKVILA